MNEASYDALMARAIAKIDARDYRSAIELLESALRIENSPSTWQLLGITYKEYGDDIKAHEALLKVVEFEPGNARAWINLGAVELDLQLFAQAAEHYMRAVELAPDRADYRIWLANAFSRAGNLADALETYGQAETLAPDDAEVFHQRAIANRNHSRFKEAAGDFRRAYELDPSRKDALESSQQMAVALHRTPSDAVPDADDRDYAAEIAALTDAIASNPRNAIYWNNRGWARRRHGDTDAALFDFDRAIQIQPDYLQARVNRAELLRRLGRRQESEQAMYEIVRLDPNFAHGLYNLAVSLLESQRFEEALALINKAIAIEATDADYYVIRGALFEGLNRKEEALAEFTRAIGMDGNHAKAYLMRGNMQFDLGRLKTAVADYSRVLQIDPDNAASHLNRGLCHFSLKNFVDARNDLERALQLNPKIGVAHLRLGEIASNENRLGDADRHFSAANSLGYPRF